jgi:hypothetical protein
MLDFGRCFIFPSSRNSLSNELQSGVDDFSGCAISSQICDSVLNGLNNLLVVTKELQSSVGKLCDEGLEIRSIKVKLESRVKKLFTQGSQTRGPRDQ